MRAAEQITDSPSRDNNDDAAAALSQRDETACSTAYYLRDCPVSVDLAVTTWRNAGRLATRWSTSDSIVLAFQYLPSLHRESEGADQAERCVVSGARSRAAAGVGLFAPMPTPLGNRRRFRM